MNIYQLDDKSLPSNQSYMDWAKNINYILIGLKHYFKFNYMYILAGPQNYFKFNYILAVQNKKKSVLNVYMNWVMKCYLQLNSKLTGPKSFLYMLLCTDCVKTYYFLSNYLVFHFTYFNHSIPEFHLYVRQRNDQDEDCLYFNDRLSTRTLKNKELF